MLRFRPAVRLIKQIDRLLGKFEAVGLTLILSVMIGLTFLQVILRNVFSGGILWADLLVRQLVLWAGFLGASLAVREHKHISIDFLPHFLPDSWEKPIRAFTHLAAAAVSAFLARAAFDFVRFEQEGGSVLFLDIPVWWFQTILPYGFCVIAVRFLIQAWDVVFAANPKA